MTTTKQGAQLQASKLRLVSCLHGAIFALANTTTLAQLQPPPTAGDVLRDLGEKAQPVPTPKPRPEIEIAPQPRRAVKPLPGFSVDVKGFRFSGLSPARAPVDAVLQEFVGLPAIPEERLQTIVRPYIGPNKSFEELQKAADAVTAYLRGLGYFVAQAFLPEQKVENGIIEIAVLEGRLGTVTLDMDARAPVSRQRLETMLSRLTPGTVLHADNLERILLIASDLRGIRVRSIVEPGPAPGTANLTVKVEPVRRFDGTIEFDNHGSRFTGELRAGASLNINSPFGRGDLLSFRGLVAVPGGGKDTEFGRVAYITPIGRYGTSVGAAYLKLNYHLGTGLFEPLMQKGESSVVSAFALHPLVRVRSVNVLMQGNFDVRTFHDDRQGLGTLSDRKVKAGTLAAVGDWRDSLLGGGSNNFSIGFTLGNVDIETASDRTADQSGRQTQGGYGKLNGSIARSQNIAERTSVYVSYAFQLASKNLDGSEKVSLGGPGTVRAYAVGEGTSDEAQLLTAELRQGLPQWSFVPGQLTGSVFYDYGLGTFNRKPLPGELNRRTLQAAGVGLTWAAQNNFLVRSSVAWRLSGAPLSDPVDRKPRIYFQLVKYM